MQRTNIRRLLTLLILLLPALLPPLRAADRTLPPVTGRITDARTGEPLCGATITVADSYVWALSDADGHFAIRRTDATADLTIEIACLGYVTRTIAVHPTNRAELQIELAYNTLAIDEVVVTARQRSEEPGSAFVIGRNALDHLQMSSVSNIAALLPGGKTVNPDLTTQQPLLLRDGGSTVGNAAFGTAIEVDGVRMGNNASFTGLAGVETRSIAVADIESVEVITGVPSAEYGDINSGLLRIRTRKGRSPWNLTFAANPRTYQFAFSKGLDLGGDHTLNLSGEWARATRNLTSPYTAYTRRGLSLTYGTAFARNVRFEAGVKANIGGMNSEADPDTFSEVFSTGRDNLLQAHTSLDWQLGRSWITNLHFEASFNFHDTRTRDHLFNSYASEQPAVHATGEGYFVADKLPYTYFSDPVVDSKELDAAAALRYEWNRKWGGTSSRLKAGLQYKATGNAGRGEYYLDPSLAANGYRPRPYADYPYMHDLSAYLEENLAVPVAGTTFSLTAGLRFEKLHIAGAAYDRTATLTPRLNARWELLPGLALRGGWGITEKLPAYYILYPRQEYRDIQTFGFSYDNNRSTYIYYTHPYQLLFNPELRWQRNHNSEVGIDAEFAGIRLSLTAYRNRTQHPYKYATSYTPFAYNLLQLPAGYTMPADPQWHVDRESGLVYVRGANEEYWTPMEIRVTDRTFIRNTMQANGSDIVRSGIELIADLPELKPLRTRFRLDAAYTHTHYVDEGLSAYYLTGWSHPSLANRSYPYVGIYANGGSSTPVVNGRTTRSLDANLTTITHIPRARIIVTCRLEMSLLKRSQNRSRYNGSDYAFNVTETSNTPVGGTIGSGSYTAVRPVAYLDLDGVMHPFTDAEAADPDFAHLILKSNNAYTFAPDGYDPYFSANLSVTKEIGNHVSLSFFANNFTNARRFVTSYATGVSAIFTPDFYYGLTCRIQF